MSYLFQNYKRFDIWFMSWKWCMLIWNNWKEYLDLLSWVWVLNLGHSHHAVLDSVKKQSEKLFHVSNYFQINNQEKLAEILCKNTFAEQVLFLNSWTESNEAAIKLARKYAFDNFPEIKKHKILALKKSFHWRTYWSLSATWQWSKKDAFKPLVPWFSFIEANDEKSLERKLDNSYCAVIIEPILWEWWVIPLNKSFIEKIRNLCNKYNVLLIFDEVQTWNWRTWKLYCYQHYNIIPDILVTSKALWNWFPIWAIMTINNIAKSFWPWTHWCTFWWNDLACSAWIASISEITKKWFLEEVTKKWEYFFDELNKLKTKYPDKIKEIRWKWLMIWIKIKWESKKIVDKLLEKWIISNAVTTDTIRLLPPLIITKEEIDLFIKVFERCIN